MSDRKKNVLHEISIRNITSDSELQPRARIDMDVVREYSDAMIDGDEFPPIDVYFDGVHYWLADGYHRMTAAVKAGKASIRCRVFQGGRDEALLHSMSANASHGVRRSQEDKRRIILRMLAHPDWCRWTNAEIARRCRVDSGTVSRYRENSPGLPGHAVTLRVTGDGKLMDCSTAKKESDATSPNALPPTPLTSSEMKDQYLRRIARALKSSDPDVRMNVETPFGNVDIVTTRKQYFLTTVHDQYTLFAAIGRARVLAFFCTDADCEPVLVGHMSPRMSTIVRAIRDTGLVEIVTPESLIAEHESAANGKGA